MVRKQATNKISVTVVYIILLYYLLPFRPAYLYYSTYHQPASEIHELKNGKEAVQGFTIQQSTRLFPIKIKTRFCLDYLLWLGPALDEIQFIIPRGKFLYLLFKLPSHFILLSLGRGPPLP